MQGRIQDFWKGGLYVQKGGVRFADFILFFLNTPWKWNTLVSLRPNYSNLVSLRPNYTIFIEHLKTGGGGGGREGVRANSLNPLWIRHCLDAGTACYQQVHPSQVPFSKTSLYIIYVHPPPGLHYHLHTHHLMATTDISFTYLYMYIKKGVLI